MHGRRLPSIRRPPTEATTFMIDFLALVPQPLIEVVQARGATTVSKQPASFGEGRRRSLEMGQSSEAPLTSMLRCKACGHV